MAKGALALQFADCLADWSQHVVHPWHFSFSLVAGHRAAAMR